MTDQQQIEDPPRLPEEHRELLVELANALLKHAMYPDGHPMLLSAADGLVQRLASVLRQRPALALGVTPRQLIVGGAATDRGNTFMVEFAGRLHRRNVGVIRFQQGVERTELVELLRVIARDGSAETGISVHQWPHVRLHPLSYGQLELLGSTPLLAAMSSDSWASGLWRELSQVALDDFGADGSLADPEAIAKAIEARDWDPAYGQKVVGFLSDVVDACRTRGGAEAAALQHRTSRLIASMSRTTLERLMALEIDSAQRQRFVNEVSEAMAVEAVLDLVQAAAAASSRTLSPAMVQLLTKLATHASRGEPGVREHAEYAFRDQVRQLISGWDHWENPAPEQYQHTLDHVPATLPVAVPRSAQPVEPERVLAISLEVGVVGPASERAVEELLAGGRVTALLDLLDHNADSPAAASIRERVLTPEALERLLAVERPDWPAVERLTDALGGRAVPPLVDLVTLAQDAAVLDHLVRLVLPLGEPAVRVVLERLPEAPWPEQRNLLVLLARFPTLPSDFAPAAFTRHEDLEIRYEALRILLGSPAVRTRAICDALATGEGRSVRAGVVAAAEQCPAAAVPVIVRLLRRHDMEEGLRPVAVRAIAAVPVRATIDCLTGLCLTRTRVLRRLRLAPRSPAMLAALRGLAAHWREDPRARPVFRLAQDSPDAEVRAAAMERAG